MTDTQKQPQDIWKTASLILIGLIIGYIIGRFELTTIEFNKNTNIKKTIKETEQISQQEKDPEEILVINTDDDAFLGADDAPIVIVEFSEYQCPFCAKMYKEIYPNLKKDFIDTGKVKYIYKDFPLTIHPNAMNAALAAECAGDQGKYFEMHDALFENQINWTKEKDPKEKFNEYALNIGLNATTFTQCYESEKYKDEINQDKEDGITYKVQATPTLFINGKLYRGVPKSYASLKTILDNEIK